MYNGTNNYTYRYLDLFDTKEQAGMLVLPTIDSSLTKAPKRSHVHWITQMVFQQVAATKTVPTILILPTTIKQDPEAELILHKTKEVHVKSEPEVEF
jgi:hypothetical protein